MASNSVTVGYIVGGKSPLAEIYEYLHSKGGIE